MLRSFSARIEAGRTRSWLAFEAPRWPIALVLALLPAAVVFLLALTALGDEVTDPQRVRDAFARYISGLITAATMAVGFAALAMRRGIKGLGELTESIRSDAEFADHVRRYTGLRAEAALGPLLAQILDALARQAEAERVDGEGAAFLADLATHARAIATRVREAGHEPDALLQASLDFEGELAIHRARLHGLREIEEGVRLADIARAYVKTLGTQWGLARMSQGIALTAFTAVAVATFMVLGFADFEPRALSALVLSAALFVVSLPLAVFVSFVTRFIFLHQHSLPLGHFVFGPENPRAVRAAPVHK